MNRIDYLAGEVRKLQARNAILHDALQAAADHLAWIDWGDGWEREAAAASGLTEKITEALKPEEK